MLKKEAGFSLVELLVAAGIIAVFSAAILQLYLTMNESSRRASTKIEKNQLTSDLELIVKNGKVCSCNFVGKTFDTGSSTAVSIDQINLYDLACNSTQVIAKSGSLIPGTQTNLKAKSIELNSFVPFGANYKATLILNYETNFSIQPTRVSVVLQATPVNPNDPNSTQMKVVNCLSTGALASAGVCPIGQYLSGFDVNENKLCFPLPVIPTSTSTTTTTTTTTTTLPFTSNMTSNANSSSPGVTHTLTAIWSNGARNSKITCKQDSSSVEASPGQTDSNGNATWGGEASCNGVPCTLGWTCSDGPNSNHLQVTLPY